MEKLLKVKDILERKVAKNREDIQSSVQEIAKMERQILSPDITVRKYQSLKAGIRANEKRFDEATTHNNVLTTVLYIIDNVLNEKEE